MHGAKWKSEGQADAETDEESHVDDCNPDERQKGLEETIKTKTEFIAR